MRGAAARGLDLEARLAAALTRANLNFARGRRVQVEGRVVAPDFVVLGMNPVLIEVKGSVRRDAEHELRLLERLALQVSRRGRALLVVVSDDASRDHGRSAIRVDATPAATLDARLDDLAAHIGTLRTGRPARPDARGPLHEYQLLDFRDTETDLLRPGTLAEWGAPTSPLPESNPAAAFANIVDAVKQLAASMEALGTHESVEAARLEAIAIADEQQSGHPTAVALRLGRCLEWAAYAFSLRYGIEPSREIPKALKAVDHALVAMIGAQDAERARLLHVIRSLLDDIESGKPDAVVAERGPIPVHRALRGVEVHLEAHHAERAREDLRKLKNHERLTTLLGARNDAAHAHPELQSREVSAERVESLLRDLLFIVQTLVDIVDASPEGALRSEPPVRPVT